MSQTFCILATRQQQILLGMDYGTAMMVAHALTEVSSRPNCPGEAQMRYDELLTLIESAFEQAIMDGTRKG